MSRYGYLLPDHDDPEDEERSYNGDEDDGNATCKRCGKTGLEWLHTGERWRLMDGRKFHVCGNENAIDDFEVLP